MWKKNGIVTDYYSQNFKPEYKVPPLASLSEQ